MHTVAATLVHIVSDTNQNQITMQKFVQSSGNVQIETATFTSSMQQQEQQLHCDNNLHTTTVARCQLLYIH